MAEKKIPAVKKKARKKPGPKPKSNAGRPTRITEEKLQILKNCFLADFTDAQACFKAEISTTAFYEYCKRNPEFAEWKEVAKKDVVMMAKLNIRQAVKNEHKGKTTDISRFVVERREKEHYSTRGEITGADGGAITIVDDIPDDDK